MRGRAPRFEDTPVTWIIALAYATVLVLTSRFDDDSTLLRPTTAAMVHHGAAAGLLLIDEPWRLLSHAFVHFGLIHIGLNLWFLTWIGPQLERDLGSVRFSVLYTISALGGGVLGALWHAPHDTFAGGSGAIFGLMGAAVGLIARRGRAQLDFLEHHGARNLMTLIGVNLVLGMMFPMISNAGHIGGLLAGFACAYWFLEKPRTAPEGVFRATQAGLIAVLASGMLYVVQPVLRFDWHLRQIATAQTEERAVEHAAALGGHVATMRVLALDYVERATRHWGDVGERLTQRWSE